MANSSLPRQLRSFLIDGANRRLVGPFRSGLEFGYVPAHDQCINPARISTRPLSIVFAMMLGILSPVLFEILFLVLFIYSIPRLIGAWMCCLPLRAYLRAAWTTGIMQPIKRGAAYVEFTTRFRLLTPAAFLQHGGVQRPCSFLTVRLPTRFTETSAAKPFAIECIEWLIQQAPRAAFGHIERRLASPGREYVALEQPRP